MTYDVAVIGGGIVGVASAMQLLAERPGLKLIILEKESRLAPHQTGRNSGVIHSGIYYKPGSLKATLAREGNRRMVAFCRDRGIPMQLCGKVIVATRPEELPLLETLYTRGLENGLAVTRLRADEVAEREPNCTAIAGIHVPSTGIVNYTKVTHAFADVVRERGGEIETSTPVRAIHAAPDRLTIECGTRTVQTKFLVNCAGLHSDRLARSMGVETGMAIIPIRGEYFMLRDEKRTLVNGLIYPVPNPEYPFLGVHLTRTVEGRLHAGPNAVLSFKREGYRKTAISLRDAAELIASSAFWRFAKANWREGSRELARSASKRLFTKSLQRMVPAVQAEDLIEPHAGVRAQALGRDGRLIDDFALIPGPRSIHVCNAPSPAATASICIGEYIARQVITAIA